MRRGYLSKDALVMGMFVNKSLWVMVACELDMPGFAFSSALLAF